LPNASGLKTREGDRLEDQLLALMHRP